VFRETLVRKVFGFEGSAIPMPHNDGCHECGYKGKGRRFYKCPNENCCAILCDECCLQPGKGSLGRCRKCRKEMELP